MFRKKIAKIMKGYEEQFKQLGNLNKFIVEVSSDGELTIKRIHFGEFGEPHEVAEIYDAKTTEQIYETLRDYYIELESEQIGKSVMDSIRRKETKK